MSWKIGSLASGLVLDLPLMEKYHNAGTDIFTDKSAYSNHGTNHGADVDTDHSTFVAANSDYVDIPHDSILDFGTGDFSISAWIKLDIVPGAYNYIISKRKFGAFKGYLFIIGTDGKLRAQIDDNNLATTWNGATDITDGIWHHVTVVADRSANGTFYLDGVVDGTPASLSGTTLSISEPLIDLVIGIASDDKSTDPFDGDIARVKIWNRSLTPAENQLSYEKTRGLYL